VRDYNAKEFIVSKVGITLREKESKQKKLNVLKMLLDEFFSVMAKSILQTVI